MRRTRRGLPFAWSKNAWSCPMSVSVRGSKAGSSEVQPTNESTVETMMINLAVKFGFILLNGDSESLNPRYNLQLSIGQRQLSTLPVLAVGGSSLNFRDRSS